MSYAVDKLSWWEEKFREWGDAPSVTERQKCENAQRVITNILKSENHHTQSLRRFDYSIELKGSFNNKTNSRGQSDVDLAVINERFCYYDERSFPPNTNAAQFGITNNFIPYETFDAAVRDALYPLRSEIVNSTTAIKVRSNTYRVDTDVMPFYRFYKYQSNILQGDRMLNGICFLKEGDIIVNWPKYDHANGIEKNQNTGRRFKKVTRILKTVNDEMYSNAPSQKVASFLIECLVYNVPDEKFRGEEFALDVYLVLDYLKDALKRQFDDIIMMEVNEIKPLFGGTQKWTVEQATRFVSDSLAYIYE